jgi:hypothetical protein
MIDKIKINIFDVKTKLNLKINSLEKYGSLTPPLLSKKYNTSKIYLLNSLINTTFARIQLKHKIKL